MLTLSYLVLKVHGWYIYFSNNFLFSISVDGQSLDVHSESVVGIFNKTITLTWTIAKFIETDVIESAVLFLSVYTDSRKPLFTDITNPVNKLQYASKHFGERITVTWSGLTYHLELKNLRYSDTVSFTLLVAQVATDFITQRNRTLKTITITDVKGIFLCLALFV